MSDGSISLTGERHGSFEEPYNPLDKGHLGESVARALLERPFNPLPPSAAFEGAGIYAIYYNGEFGPYSPLAVGHRAETSKIPIYIGEAVPSGARKGRVGPSASRSRALYNRLRQHANSIEDTNNLNLADFSCRFLVVDDIWIPLGEALLIEMFSPLWNKVIDGFGNHDPGRGRYNQQRSAWDVVHPGRPWADRCALHHRTRDDLLLSISDYFSGDK